MSEMKILLVTHGLFISSSNKMLLSYLSTSINIEVFNVEAIFCSCLPMQAFSVVFQNAIDRAEKSTEVKQRVTNLIDSITYLVFMYTSRGLFERDKLIFTSQVTFQVMGKMAMFM